MSISHSNAKLAITLAIVQKPLAFELHHSFTENNLVYLPLMLVLSFHEIEGLSSRASGPAPISL